MGALGFQQALWLLLLPPVLFLAWRIPRSVRPRLSPPRERVVRVLRPLSLTLLILALAGLHFERPIDRLTLLFAVDTSRSVGGPGHPQAAEWLTAASRLRPDGDLLGVVAFAEDAMIDVPPGKNAISEVLARPSDAATDLASAIRLARGLLPPDEEARLVLVGDGVETRGSVEEALAGLSENIDVVWIPLPGRLGKDVLVEQISVPERVTAGEPHRVRVVLRSSEATTARLRLDRGGLPAAVAVVELKPDEPAVYSFDQIAPEGGALLYQARVEADGDAVPENDRAEALVAVEGRPTVLVVDREPAAAARFGAALEDSGMQVRVGGPEALPGGVSGLVAWDAVVLSDVAATRFSEQQLEALARWVEDLGGGLLMLGGPEGFGKGGYWETPVEDVLPLAMEVKDTSYFPSVGIVLAIDKSGSMAGTVGPSQGAQKIEMAKTAAAAVADLIEPMDQLGVIAFDGAAKWIAPLQSGRNSDGIKGQLGRLRAGGGTDAYPAMELAHEALKDADVRVKHLLLLTDGMLSSRNHEGLAGEMETYGITVSAVGVGPDADVRTLERIARSGGGSFYQAFDAERLPRIFLRDAFRVARSWIVEETFRPVPVGATRHPALGGLDPAALPALDGYVAASEKASATHLLQSPRGDPLLSVWRVGLGKAAAFTSDAKSRWASRWMGSSEALRIWPALTRWTIRDAAAGRLRLSTTTSGGRLQIAADLLDAGGGFVNGANLRARVIAPDGTRREISLRQEGPGRYSGEIEASEEGPYLAAVVRETQGETRGEGATIAAVVPYADELRTLGRSPDSLERLTAAGRVRRIDATAIDQAPSLYERRGVGAKTRTSLVPLLAALCAVLLLLETAARKLALPRLPVRAASTVQEERMDALQRARGRVRRRTNESETGKPESKKISVPPAEAPSVTPIETPPDMPPVTTPAETSTEPSPAEDVADGATEPDAYTSRLLKAKRRRRRRRS